MTVDFPDVRARLAGSEPADTLSAFAGLQLDPENANRLERLRAAAEVAASLSGGPRAASAPLLREVLNRSILADRLAPREDPFDDVLVEELPFHGGSYRLGSGL